MQTPAAAVRPSSLAVGETPNTGQPTMEAIEQSKENYVPVRSGRRTAALAEVGDPAASATKQALEQRRRELVQAVREYSGTDPIDPWLR